MYTLRILDVHWRLFPVSDVLTSARSTEADSTPRMAPLSFELPDGSTTDVEVTHLLNAGYAGREQDEVQAHIAELAVLVSPGPAPRRRFTPSLLTSPSRPPKSASSMLGPRAKPSGRWSLPRTMSWLTVACDHTDRALEVHGVAWSKNASPDVLGRKAWRLDDVRAAWTGSR